MRKNKINRFRNALILMRIPFSLYLMPVFWLSMVGLSLAHETEINIYTAIGIFILLHLLVYPASNGYNSFYDRDKGSIGGVEFPPEATPMLYRLVLIFDIASLMLSLLLGINVFIFTLLYVLVSKAYSHPRIRLKKYPIASTLTVLFFQGFFTFFWVQEAATSQGFEVWNSNGLLAFCASLFLAGSYPLTQIYQHQEDKARGDYTLSLRLGINGTFIFSGIMFSLAAGLMSAIFWFKDKPHFIVIFFLSTLPSLSFLLTWFIKCSKNPEEVNFTNTMKMNKRSSLFLSFGFIVMLLWELYQK